MNTQYVSFTIVSLLVACLLSQTSYALSNKLISTHGLRLTPSGHYQITGKDAYFVMPLEASLQQEISDNLQFEITIQRPDDSQTDLKLELFFKPLESQEKLNFDPLYRIQYQLPMADFDKILLPIPKEVSLSKGQLLRFDIEACFGCLINVSSAFNFGKPVPVNSEPVNTSTAQSETRISTGATVRANKLSFLNGVHALPKAGQLINPNEWRLHDLNLEPNALTVTDGDPFLVSPQLDVDSRDFAGIVIEINAPPKQPPIYDFQLFYATNAHAFIERASSIIRIVSERETNMEFNKLRFFVPLNFLSEQMPAAKILKRLRLDLVLPRTYNSTNGGYLNDNGLDTRTANQWSLPSVMLVNKAQRSSIQGLMPAQIVHSKRQRASLSTLVRQILNKIIRDIGFSIFYAFLLISVSIIMVRKYRRSK